VAGHAAVGVDDDLAAGEARVADRAADHEAPRRVDEQVLAQLAGVVEVAREDRLDDVLPEVVGDQRLGALAVLRGDQELLDLDRHAIAVAHRDLRLAVRAQVGDDVGAAHVGEALGELVGQRDRQRHELGRLARRVAEHHPLVARAGDVQSVVVGGIRPCLVRRVHALRDVRRLLVDRVDDRARVGREAEIGVGVADLADRGARDVLDVDVGLCRDLARDDDEPRVHERLARHAPVGIVAHDRVQDPVGDLVGHLVRVTLGDRLRGEEVLVLSKRGHGSATGSAVRGMEGPDGRATAGRRGRARARA
jgi:hypothetical protein